MNQEIIKAYLEMSRAFSRDLSEDQLSIYLKSLSDFKEDDVVRSFKKAIKECKFFPTVHEIIEIINRPKPEEKKYIEGPSQVDWTNNPFENERKLFNSGKMSKDEYFKIMAEKMVDNFLNEYVPQYIPSPSEEIKAYVNARIMKLQQTQRPLSVELGEWITTFHKQVELYVNTYQHLKNDIQYLKGERLRKLKEKLNDYDKKKKYLDHVFFKQALHVLDSDSNFLRTN